MQFQFIHAADLHLDSPMKGLERYEGFPAELFRNATRRALENLVQLAIDKQVAFVLLAGDIYDSDWQDTNTGLFFIRQMSRLQEAEIPVVMIAGNHDATSKMSRELPLPTRVTLLNDSAPETKILETVGVAIHGQSFAKPATYDNLAERYPVPLKNLLNIGLLHTCLTSQEHARYAPCDINELILKNYDYWALGHVHQRQVFQAVPWIGFPGNTQGRHIRETGPKGCYLVSVDHDRSMNAEFQAVDVTRWENCHLDATGMTSTDELYDAFSSRLEYLIPQAEGRPVALRVEVNGETERHQSLIAKPHYWTEEFRAIAIAKGNGITWIEKVKFLTSLPAQQANHHMAELAWGELQQVVDAVLNTDANDLLDKFSFVDVQKKLPVDLLELISVTQADWLKAKIAEAEALLQEELRAVEGPV